MRDIKKHRQVTIMPDRTQGGSSGLLNNTIELMQNRRMIEDDGKGVQEPLNETDFNDHGIKSTALYRM